MPIFMIGTQRSGSNLLRLMLNQLPNLAAPHPPHILERLAPLMPVYGDLGDDTAFATLVEDVCRLVELNPVPWEGVKLPRNAVAARCRERSLVAVYGAVHDIMAQAWGKRDWCCKSLANVHHLPAINAYFPDARFIYIYRDGRNVALSFREAIVGEKHFYHIARAWHQEQQLALEFADNILPERVFRISYEALTTAPETTLRALCAFLQADYTEEMMRFNESREAQLTAQAGAMWSNVVKTVGAHRPRRFQEEADASDIRIFEAVAGPSLDRLGYTRRCVPPGAEITFDATTLAEFDAENRRLKAEKQAQLPPDEGRRREPQNRLLAAIAARGLPAAAAAPNP